MGQGKIVEVCAEPGEYTFDASTGSNIRLNNGRARYALYPVWILNTKWNDWNFTFAINGQTGKIAGDLPMDKGAFYKWLATVSGGRSRGGGSF